MNIVLLGPPGSGKGTQAKRLAQKYSHPHVSTGDMFRQEISKKTELGLRVEDYVKSGRLVPDDLTIEVVSGRLSAPDCAVGFILDGFPRTVEQAEALSASLSSSKRELDKVVCLELSESEVVGRLSARRQCEKCGKIYNLKFQPPRQADQCDVDGGKLVQREDDAPETIKKRLVVYSQLTEPLISYYRGEGILAAINANKDVEAVSEEIYAVLDAVKK